MSRPLPKLRAEMTSTSKCPLVMMKPNFISPTSIREPKKNFIEKKIHIIRFDMESIYSTSISPSPSMCDRVEVLIESLSDVRPSELDPLSRRLLISGKSRSRPALDDRWLSIDLRLPVRSTIDRDMMAVALFRLGLLGDSTCRLLEAIAGPRWESLFIIMVDEGAFVTGILSIELWRKLIVRDGDMFMVKLSPERRI